MEMIRLQGRTLSDDDLKTVRALIDEYPQCNRTALSVRLCQLWNWRKDRKSTRLNSSHGSISYAVFCLKKKNLNDDEQPFHRELEECDAEAQTATGAAH